MSQQQEVEQEGSAAAGYGSGFGGVGAYPYGGYPGSPAGNGYGSGPAYGSY